MPTDGTGSAWMEATLRFAYGRSVLTASRVHGAAELLGSSLPDSSARYEKTRRTARPATEMARLARDHIPRPALPYSPTSDGGAGNRTLVRVSFQNCVYVCRL